MGERGLVQSPAWDPRRGGGLASRGTKDKPLPVVVLTQPSRAQVPGPQSPSPTAPPPPPPPVPGVCNKPRPVRLLQALPMEHPTPAAAAPGHCLPKNLPESGKSSAKGPSRVLSPGKTKAAPGPAEQLGVPGVATPTPGKGCLERSRAKGGSRADSPRRNSLGLTTVADDRDDQ